jgi:hypothetical protein
MKKITLFLFLFLIGAHNAFAFDFTRPNNKFGIHLAQPHLSDLKKTQELVNSNRGDWGYITLVIQENDRSHQKWQEIFDLLREYHLIPIIRLATHPEGTIWPRPNREEIQNWVDFLDSLHWIVKNRYVILFNEPNHGSEWGGRVDAYDYAETAKIFAEKLKAKNSDFFIMLGAIDASAPNGMPFYLGEENFFQNFLQKISVQDFERLFDGLASHSYPNPAFAGTPWAAGRGTVRSYDWELNLLKNLGVQKNLPVFITETGWSAERLSRDTIASYFQTAYESIWLPDERVIAVTPFVLDYQGEPFLNFSWKQFQNEEYFSQYYAVQSLSKTQGEPEQIEKGKITVDLPKELVASSNYHLRVKLKNEGQAIWDKDFGYKISIISNQEKKPVEFFVADLKHIKPYEEADIDLYIKTNASGKFTSKIILLKKDKTILEMQDWRFEVVPLPSLDFKTTLFPKLITQGENFEIQIFDEKEELVFKRKGLRMNNSISHLNDIQNIIPGKRYRVVILNPYYLPRQSFMTFKRGTNSIKFKRMFPLDLNNNGHFDSKDMFELLNNLELIRLFFP